MTILQAMCLAALITAGVATVAWLVVTLLGLWMVLYNHLVPALVSPFAFGCGEVMLVMFVIFSAVIWFTTNTYSTRK